ncbi:hypothetical protein [Spiroplasma endosymbiont of Crioceris asparagi]|uniref:hypothetical protein n=1 Tax=Spiroplasma endosymbiont of Crioceris asparagi TaxID=3066286 RepID=UPI0030D5A229
MKALKSTRYLTTTALISAILTTISLIFSLLAKFGGNAIFQPADGLYIALIVYIKGPMMIICGIVYVTITDLASGGFAYIPISIFVRILMFVFVYYLSKKITVYISMFLATICLLIYVFYSYILFGEEMAKYELITDLIQMVVCYALGIIFFFSFKRLNFIWTKINNEFYVKN